MSRAAMVSVSLISVSILAAMALPGSPAMAQGNPSSAQIIQSLKPTGNLLQGGTRGIRMVNPDATSRHATHTAAASAAHAVTAGASAPSISLSVEFATDSANLTPRAQRTLDELGKALTSDALAQYHFRVEGHTDTVGSQAYNKTLSQQRADAVAHYLEGKFGVKADRLDPVGMGEDGLVVLTPPNTPNERNRRVHVVNLGA
jgi:outer membrane protein OmpA-like peptidoglycan-associated protein